MVALVAVMAVTVVGQAFTPFAQHPEDMRRLLNGAQSLISGRPPGELLLVYPASSAVQYVPLALLPRGVTEIMLRIVCAALLVWIVASFARDDRGRLQPWALVLLVSPPVIDVLRLDQFNTTLALAALVVANRLLSSRRPFVAGLAAGVSMSRPFAAAPVIAGVLGGGRRTAVRMAVGIVLFVGMTVGVAFAWDHALLHDIATTGAHRPLVGPIAFIRAHLGLSGAIVAVALIGVLCALINRAGRDRPVDAFAAMLAISCLGVHLGGPYVAVFALPGLARLAATMSPWWAVGTTLAYEALVLAAVDPAAFGAIGPFVTGAFVRAPLLCGVLPLCLLYRPLGARRQTAAVRPGAVPAIETA